MKKEISRRELIGRAGLAIGGAVTFGALQAACSSEDTTPSVEQPVTEPAVSDFPYEQHLPAGYQLDATPVREDAYHAYYAGGCCHAAFSSLLTQLRTTAGAPFDKLPIDFGKFGGGGIDGYGSICGALLGSVLITNMVVGDAAARKAIITDLIRWYENGTTTFPSYVPAAIDTAEVGKTTKDFSAANVANLQVAPGSHLCHASVTGWCSAMGVAADGADKKARCARLSADVAAKCAESLNGYLASAAFGARKFTAAAIDATSAGCLASCHAPGTTGHPVAAGMRCTVCHPGNTAVHY